MRAEEKRTALWHNWALKVTVANTLVYMSCLLILLSPAYPHNPRSVWKSFPASNATVPSARPLAYGDTCGWITKGSNGSTPAGTDQLAYLLCYWKRMNGWVGGCCVPVVSSSASLKTGTRNTHDCLDRSALSRPFSPVILWQVRLRLVMCHPFVFRSLVLARLASIFLVLCSLLSCHSLGFHIVWGQRRGDNTGEGRTSGLKTSFVVPFFERRLTFTAHWIQWRINREASNWSPKHADAILESPSAAVMKSSI